MTGKKFNPFTGKLQWFEEGGGSVGGLYGINVETLVGDKTLTSGTDEIYQYLNMGGANRIVTLDTGSVSTGDRFVIRMDDARDSTMQLIIKQGATILDYVYAANIKGFIFDGTNWVASVVGTGGASEQRENTALGYYSIARGYGTAIGALANGAHSGTAIGRNANGYNYGAAVGMSSYAQTFSAAIGFSAKAQNYSTALGAYAYSRNKYYSNAIGYYAKTTRYGETAISIDGSSTQKNNINIIGFRGSTTDDTPSEIFCGGVANQRCTVRASSAMSFNIIVTARDNTANEVAKYSFDGLIKRDGAGNTVLSYLTTNVDYEDDATWDCAVTADDVNEALIITVTGDADNTVQWAARLDGVETHF